MFKKKNKGKRKKKEKRGEKSQTETYWERFLLAEEEVAPNHTKPRSWVAEEAPPPLPRSPALLLHTLGREGSSQFARSAAAPSSLLLLPSHSLLQPFTTFLPATSSYHRPVQWLHFPQGWQRSRREIKPGEQCKGE